MGAGYYFRWVITVSAVEAHGSTGDSSAKD